MPTKLQIVNQSLVQLGQDPLTSIDQNIRTARFAKASWPMLRDEVLRQHPWNFAVKRVILGENLLTYSEEFDDADWTKTNATIAADSVRAPDGNTTADTLTSSSAGTVVQSETVPNNDQAYVFSVYLKQGSAAITAVSLAFSGGSTASSTTANITWGSTPTTDEGTLTDEGQGWWRISIGAENNSSGHTSLACTIYPSSATAASTGTVYAWGAQLIRGSTVNGYVQTEDTDIQSFTPTHGYAYGFNLPCDFIRHVRLDDLSLPYRIEGRTIVSNESIVYLEYIGRVLDTCDWDALFAAVMVIRMAAELCIPLTGDTGRAVYFMQLYKDKLNDGQWADSKEQQQPGDDFNGCTWLYAHQGAW